MCCLWYLSNCSVHNQWFLKNFTEIANYPQIVDKRVRLPYHHLLTGSCLEERCGIGSLSVELCTIPWHLQMVEDNTVIRVILGIKSISAIHWTISIVLCFYGKAWHTVIWLDSLRGTKEHLKGKCKDFISSTSKINSRKCR